MRTHQNGFELYERMKHVYIDELHTSPKTFEEAALYCKNTLLQYYKELPDNLLHAAVGTWLRLKLQHRTSKITHLVASDNNNDARKLRCLLCDCDNPKHVVTSTSSITTGLRVLYYFFACEKCQMNG